MTPINTAHREESTWSTFFVRTPWPDLQTLGSLASSLVIAAGKAMDSAPLAISSSGLLTKQLCALATTSRNELSSAVATTLLAGSTMAAALSRKNPALINGPVAALAAYGPYAALCCHAISGILAARELIKGRQVEEAERKDLRMTLTSSIVSSSAMLFVGACGGGPITLAATGLACGIFKAVASREASTAVLSAGVAASLVPSYGTVAAFASAAPYIALGIDLVPEIVQGWHFLSYLERKHHMRDVNDRMVAAFYAEHGRTPNVQTEAQARAILGFSREQALPIEKLDQRYRDQYLWLARGKKYADEGTYLWVEINWWLEARNQAYLVLGGDRSKLNPTRPNEVD